MEVEVLLRRLTDRRGWKAVAVARDAGDDVAAPETLRRLAPALGWHTADLFALVGHDLPADLAPTDPKADPGRMAWDYVAVPPARPILLAAARAMPQQPLVGPLPPPLRPFPKDKARAIIGRLLHYRNLKGTSAAQLLLYSGGPYLSSSTVNQIAIEGKMLAPQLVSGFAHFLGIPVGDLAVLCDVDMTEDVPAPAYSDGLAELMWEGRRLTCQQIRELLALGHDLRHRFDAELDEGVRCRCGRTQ
ncbi:hypothetical protein [Micromonospora sagamiensis]|uniref:Uncharacterized protein n=1 Tax=Micromonospora sagamiensis TaxID=47875 RepID=A0A562WE46_9ACTN|nr:hypothetical protein [Micromonospora sagamiensis]TWJ27834.1 hypothetical protein JD81_01334 [Micromonospora sagamiensis]BCL13277.1 hypothetical protein GCM10017556_10160 [Micromonospora sagamiensis]